MVMGAAAYLAFRLVDLEGAVSPVDRRVEAAMILFLTVSAFLLRGPGIGEIPPGVWVDEAVEGLQAGAALAGERLPDLADSSVMYPRWPVWWMLERLAVAVGGMTASAIRAPAVVVGTLSVPLAWWVVRSLAGPLAGLASAAFLAFSFWHIQLSRIGVAPVLLVPEILLAAWILFAPQKRERRLAGLGAGALCAIACSDYPAAYALPLWCGVTAVLMMLFPGEETGRGRRYAGRWIIGGIAGFMALVFLVPGIQALARLGRVNSVGFANPLDIVAQAVICLANHFVPVGHTVFIWDGFPPGAPRFSPVENIAWLSGLAGVLVRPGFSRWARLALVAGVPLLLLPEMLPGTLGGVYLVRGTASLGLMAILAGLSVRLWSPLAGRASLGVLCAVSVVSAWHMAGITYGPFARSELSRRIYSGVAGDVADVIRVISRQGPVSVFPPLSYAENPQIAFHLWGEIRAGRVRAADAPPREDRALAVFLDPVGRQPVVALVAARDFSRSRVVGLLDVQAAMMEGQALEKGGKTAAAGAVYRMVARLIPAYREARIALGLVLIKQGKGAEGRQLLAEAGRQARLPAEIRAKLAQ